MYVGMIRRLFASSATIALIVCSVPSFGQSPQGPVVAAGSIAVTRQGATTVVTQGTDKGVIDWRSFSIGASEAVRFDQPGRSSVTLNRVTGAELSRIDGNLSATGQVWLANPNGVLIGPSGQINLGGLLMTTGRVDAPEFLRSGKALIDQVPSQAGVANSGVISIAAGGYAALAAASIRNEGVIIARAGSVALGTGRAMTVDFVGDRLIQFQVSQPLDQAPAGADALITSSGKILAEGSTVTMSARAAKGVMNNVINLSGHVVANAVRVDGGTVTFGDGGTVQVSAGIDASRATGKGGTVAVLGERVGLMDGASIDVSGADGGTVSIGGDWQGRGPNQNALVTYVAPTATIRAEGNQSGNGGKVAVWADETTRFNGTITAMGGAVETSGKKTLQVGPVALVKAGSWLLDPTNITIQSSGGGSVTGTAPDFLFSPSSSSSISDSTIVAALANGNVTVQTSGGSDGSG
jgi:filamentous hemagglutinin family protein